MQWPANNTFWRLMGCSETQRLLEVFKTKRTSFEDSLLILLTLFQWPPQKQANRRRRNNYLTYRIRAKIFLLRKPPDKCEFTRKQTLKISLNRSWSTINPLKTSRIGLLVPFATDFQIYNLNWCVTESSTHWLPGLVTPVSALRVCTLKSRFCHAIWPRIA